MVPKSELNVLIYYYEILRETEVISIQKVNHKGNNNYKDGMPYIV